MKIAELKINPFTEKSNISVGGKAVSNISKLSEFSHRHFLSWADEFYSNVFKIFNDPYEVCVAAHDFDVIFFDALHQKDENCVGYHKKRFQIPTTVKERSELIKPLKRKYLSETYDAKPMTLDKVVTAGSEEELAAYIRENITRIILVPDEDEEISISGKSYIWKIPEEKISQVILLAKERFVDIAMLSSDIKQLESKSEFMAPEELKILDVVRAIDPVIVVNRAEAIERGKAFSYHLSTIPHDSLTVDVRMESGDKKIIDVSEKYTILGKMPGKSKVSFFKPDENEPFYEEEVCVYERNRVSRIDLVERDIVIAEEDTRRIGYDVFPTDADDMETLHWEVSDGNIVSIDKSGLLRGMKKGVCRIALVSEECSAEANVTVKERAKCISLSRSMVDCYIGDKTLIESKAEPADCFDNRIEAESNNLNVAKIIKDETGKTYIFAIKVGECGIKFKTADGSAEATCNVKVRSTFEENYKGNIALTICGICMILTLVCIVFGIEILGYVGMGATVVSGIAAVFKKQKDWIWALILAVVPFVLKFVIL